MKNLQTGIETTFIKGTRATIIHVESEWYDSDSSYHEPKKSYLEQTKIQLFNDIKPN